MQTAWAAFWGTLVFFICVLCLAEYGSIIWWGQAVVCIAAGLAAYAEWHCSYCRPLTMGMAAFLMYGHLCLATGICVFIIVWLYPLFPVCPYGDVDFPVDRWRDWHFTIDKTAFENHFRRVLHREGCGPRLHMYPPGYLRAMLGTILRHYRAERHGDLQYYQPSLSPGIGRVDVSSGCCYVSFVAYLRHASKINCINWMLVLKYNWRLAAHLHFQRRIILQEAHTWYGTHLQDLLASDVWWSIDSYYITFSEGARVYFTIEKPTYRYCLYGERCSWLRECPYFHKQCELVRPEDQALVEPYKACLEYFFASHVGQCCVGGRGLNIGGEHLFRIE